MAKDNKERDIADRVALSALAYCIVARTVKTTKRLPLRKKRVLKKLMTDLKKDPERDWFNDTFEKGLFIRILCLARAQMKVENLDKLISLKLFSPRCRAFYEGCMKETEDILTK